MDALSTFGIDLTGVTNTTLFQIYCLNPPSDGCPHGPCPNPDVTGVGQQVSICVTSTIFAITLIWGLEGLQFAWGAYLANIYALFIAATVSISNQGLSQSDAIFVLVASASPATIYIWGISCFTLLRGPSRFMGDSIPLKRDRFILISLTLFSAVAWLAILLTTVLQTNHNKIFSQPNCDAAYETPQIFRLLWIVTFLSSLLIIILFLWVVMIIRRTWPPSRGKREDVPRQNSLIKWTAASLQTCISPLPSSFQSRTILFLLQISCLQDTIVTSVAPLLALDPSFAGQAVDTSEYNDALHYTILVITILVTLILAKPPSLSISRKHITYKNKEIIFGFGILVVIVGCTLATFALPYIPSPMDILVIYYCGFIWWKHLDHANLFYKLSLPLLAMIIRELIWLSFWTTPIFSPLIIWLSVWQMFSCSRSARWPEARTLWHQLTDGAHILKASFFIIGPTSMWIKATLVANHGPVSVVLSFGQLFSLITALAASMSLVAQFYDRRAEIWDAILMQDVLDGSSQDLPLHDLLKATPNPDEASSPPLRPVSSTRAQPAEAAGDQDASVPFLAHDLPSGTDIMTRRNSFAEDSSDVNGIATHVRPLPSSSDPPSDPTYNS